MPRGAGASSPTGGVHIGGPAAPAHGTLCGPWSRRAEEPGGGGVPASCSALPPHTPRRRCHDYPGLLDEDAGTCLGRQRGQ